MTIAPPNPFHWMHHRDYVLDDYKIREYDAAGNLTAAGFWWPERTFTNRGCLIAVLAWTLIFIVPMFFFWFLIRAVGRVDWLTAFFWLLMIFASWGAYYFFFKIRLKQPQRCCAIFRDDGTIWVAERTHFWPNDPPELRIMRKNNKWIDGLLSVDSGPVLALSGAQFRIGDYPVWAVNFLYASGERPQISEWLFSEDDARIITRQLTLALVEMREQTGLELGT